MSIVACCFSGRISWRRGFGRRLLSCRAISPSSLLVASGERVYGVRVLETTLEEIYLEAVGDDAG